MNINKLFFILLYGLFINITIVSNPSCQSLSTRLTKFGLGTTYTAAGLLCGTLTRLAFRGIGKEDTLGGLIVATLSTGFAGKLTILGLSTIAHGIKGTEMNVKNNLLATSRIFMGSSLMGITAYALANIATSPSHNIEQPYRICLQAMCAGLGAIGTAQILKGFDRAKQEFEKSK
jgi:hypothetical protein